VSLPLKSTLKCKYAERSAPSPINSRFVSERLLLQHAMSLKFPLKYGNETKVDNGGSTLAILYDIDFDPKNI
jgi:hypothetical protein